MLATPEPERFAVCGVQNAVLSVSWNTTVPVGTIPAGSAGCPADGVSTTVSGIGKPGGTDAHAGPGEPQPDESLTVTSRANFVNTSADGAVIPA